MMELKNYIIDELTSNWGKYKDIFFIGSDCIYKESEFIYNENLFNESLIKSYDTIKSIKYVIKRLQDKNLLVPNNLKVEYDKLIKQNEKESISNHIKFFITQDSFSEELMDEIIDSFKFCGYYMISHFSRKESKSSTKTIEVLQFEPRYDKNKVTLPSKIYHITNIDNIKELKPQNKSILGINYPPRIYFFTIYDKELFQSYIRLSRKKLDNDTFYCYTIDTTKINKNGNKKSIDFFIDYDFSINGKSSQKCIYIYEPLRKECIIDKEEIKFK